jgi:hypothetical protein
MRRLLFLSFFTVHLFISFGALAQQINESVIEQDLYKYFQRIDYWGDLNIKHRKDADGSRYNDSLTDAKRALKMKLGDYFLRFPYTIKFKYESLTTLMLDAPVSDDYKLKIYSWQTFRGGSWHNFENIAQYTMVIKPIQQH